MAMFIAAARISTRSLRTLQLQALAVVCCGAIAPQASLDEPVDQTERGVHVVPLHMYRSMVRDKEDVLAFRTTYIGEVSLGTPASQKFNVIFDSGSGQVIVPSAECASQTCMMHARFNRSASQDAVSVQMDGRATPIHSTPESVSIQFGAGSVTGTMVKETFCVSVGGSTADGAARVTCTRMNAVTATQLSTNPFGIFPFDGIVGLGLPRLSLTKEFNFIQALQESGQIARQQFAFYLSESGEGSELAIGGANPEQLDSSLRWTDVVVPDMGHWQVEIVSFTVGNVTLDLCREGGCRGVVDTGTSHIAIPSPFEELVLPMIASPAEGRHDCRFVDDYPAIIIGLRGFNLTLHPQDYMRQMQLPTDMQIGAGNSKTGNSVSAANSTAPSMAKDEEETHNRTWSCRSRVVGVEMPPHIGSKTFIIGQPVFHRYYTVFDYEGPRLGFGLAAARSVEPTDDAWNQPESDAELHLT